MDEREQLIEEAIDKEFANKWFEDEADFIMQTSKFRKGIKWADEHPSEDLIKKEKVYEWIEKYIADATGIDSSALIESFDEFIYE